jgi:hypothetical protein
LTLRSIAFDLPYFESGIFEIRGENLDVLFFRAWSYQQKYPEKKSLNSRVRLLEF